MSPIRLTALCALLFFLVGCSGSGSSGEDSYSSKTEDMRVTSPNGKLDAVLATYTYGPAAGGGVDSNVYIVRKGAPSIYKTGREVFSADPMSCGKVVWTQDHILEIHYDIANIHSFRNTWGLDEIQSLAGPDSDFVVEIRLVP